MRIVTCSLGTWIWMMLGMGLISAMPELACLVTATSVPPQGCCCGLVGHLGQQLDLDLSKACGAFRCGSTVWRPSWQVE